jgi:4-hydroxy-4-methyl-2-oxoglutarate aldolase
MRAVDETPSGAVLVIDSGAESHAASWGGSATLAAIKRAIVGVVTNGTVRDLHTIRELGFPVFCGGISVRGAYRNGAGVIGEAVTLGGRTVAPGDLVVGDEDGVVVVAGASLDAVFAAAVKRNQMEMEADVRLRAGESYAAVAGIKTGKKG